MLKKLVRRPNRKND